MSRFLNWMIDSTPLRLLFTRIRYKLLAGLLMVSLIPLIALGVATYTATEEALRAEAANRLEAVRALQARQIEGYFENLTLQLQVVAESRATVDALREFSAQFSTFRQENSIAAADIDGLRRGLRQFYEQEFSPAYHQHTDRNPQLLSRLNQMSDDAIALQSFYLGGNPHPLGQKAALERAEDKSKYSQTHLQHHPALRGLVRQLGLGDLYLINELGDIVYSCNKELDFATNLKSGAEANSNLGRAFQLALASESTQSVTQVDFAAYFPTHESAASFLACPLHDGETKVGVLALRVPLDRVNALTAEHSGLGQTGETYLVGPDKLLRSDSRFVKEMSTRTTALNPQFPVPSEAVADALAGRVGIHSTVNYRGQPVLSAFTPVTIHRGQGTAPLTWALLSEISLAEIHEPARQMFWYSLAIVSAATALVIIAAVLYSRGLTRQTDAISRMLNHIGVGIFNARAEVVTRDELGLIAESLNSMCDNTLSLIQSQEERDRLRDAVSKLQDEVERIATGDLTIRAEASEGLTVDIASSINSMVAQLQEIVRNVQVATNQVSTSATQIRSAAEQLAQGSTEQSRQIQTASGTVSQMALSIQDVSGSTQTSAAVAEQARQTALRGAQAVHNTIRGMERIRDQVQGTSKRIKRLGETSQEVGEIVQLIGDIADRTSILALNASIQAAMAGDAGQGFAVVAEEVERLAERANDATRRIGGLIKSMQGETAEAIAAMEESTRDVVAGTQLADEAGQALEAIDAVSRELTEQIRGISTATREQARQAESAAKAMDNLSVVTTHTASGTRQAAESINSLAQLADALRDSVSQFKLPMRNGQIYTHDDDPTAALGRLVETALKG